MEIMFWGIAIHPNYTDAGLARSYYAGTRQVLCRCTWHLTTSSLCGARAPACVKCERLLVGKPGTCGGTLAAARVARLSLLRWFASLFWGTQIRARRARLFYSNMAHSAGPPVLV